MTTQEQHQQVASAIKRWVDLCGGAIVATKEDILSFLQEELPDVPHRVREHFPRGFTRHGLATASYKCGLSDSVRLVYDKRKFPDSSRARTHVEKRGLSDSVQAELMNVRASDLKLVSA